MGRPGYLAEFRRKVLDLLAGGRSVASIAYDLGISDQTIYAWRRQDRIDRGEVPGLTTGEKAVLAAAKKRIAQLETELAVAQRAVEVLQGRPAQKEVRGDRIDRRGQSVGACRGGSTGAASTRRP